MLISVTLFFSFKFMSCEKKMSCNSIFGGVRNLLILHPWNGFLSCWCFFFPNRICCGEVFEYTVGALINCALRFCGSSPKASPSQGYGDVGDVYFVVTVFLFFSFLVFLQDYHAIVHSFATVQYNLQCFNVSCEINAQIFVQSVHHVELCFLIY